MFRNILFFGFPAWAEILLAVLAELIFGKAKAFNPAKWAGWAVRKIDGQIRLSLGQSRANRERSRAFIACGALAVAAAASVWGIAALLQAVGGLFAASLFRVFAVYAALDVRRPLWHTVSMLKALKGANKDQARRALSRITDKDTEKMSEQGMVRTAVEECAIALSEGGLLPLVFAGFGMLIGVPNGTLNAALCWAALSVMMLGRAANRAFDARPGYTAAVRQVGNYLSSIPARLGAVMAMIAAWIIRLDAKTAAGNLLLGVAAAPDLNRGFLLGAFSGALRMRLGGGGYYSGQWRPMANIGVDFDQPDRERLPSALLLTGLSFLFGALLCVISPFIAALAALLLSLMMLKNSRGF